MVDNISHYYINVDVHPGVSPWSCDLERFPGHVIPAVMMLPGHVISRGPHAGSVDVGRQHGRPHRPTLQTHVARCSTERRQAVVSGRRPVDTDLRVGDQEIQT